MRKLLFSTNPFAAMTRFLFLSAFACLSASQTALGQTVPERYTVPSDGHPMAVWAKSSTNPSRVVLLLHGRTWSSLPDFDLQVPGEQLSLMDALRDQGYAVYGLDLRGYGGTPRDSTAWLTPERAAADVAAVLKWLNSRHSKLDKPVVFGWSYGCLSAQLCAQAHPELVSGLILFGYPGFAGKPWPLYEDAPKPANRKNTPEAAASDFITPGSISQKAIDAYVNAALAADSVRVDWRRLNEWNRLDPAKVTTPLLLLDGQYDPVIERYTQIDLFTRLGTADRQWVVIPGGDHATFMETPRPLFLRVLTDFINRIGLR